MAAYALVALNVNDSETLLKYAEGAFASMQDYAPEVLAVNDDPEVLEGDLPGHHMAIVKFRNKEDLREWWNSEEYANVKPLRHASADTPFILALDSYEAE